MTFLTHAFGGADDLGCAAKDKQIHDTSSQVPGPAQAVHVCQQHGRPGQGSRHGPVHGGGMSVAVQDVHVLLLQDADEL